MSHSRHVGAKLTDEAIRSIYLEFVNSQEKIMQENKQDDFRPKEYEEEHLLALEEKGLALDRKTRHLFQSKYPAADLFENPETDERNHLAGVILDWARVRVYLVEAGHNKISYRELEETFDKAIKLFASPAESREAQKTKDKLLALNNPSKKRAASSTGDINKLLPQESRPRAPAPSSILALLPSAIAEIETARAASAAERVETPEIATSSQSLKRQRYGKS